MVDTSYSEGPGLDKRLEGMINVFDFLTAGKFFDSALRKATTISIYVIPSFSFSVLTYRVAQTSINVK
jgi:hypothetical protein